MTEFETDYRLLSPRFIEMYAPYMEDLSVSERARRSDGFMAKLLRNKKSIYKLYSDIYPGAKHSYMVEREGFIKRTLAAYNKEPSLRRWLALIAWAYLPPRMPPLSDVKDGELAYLILQLY